MAAAWLAVGTAVMLVAGTVWWLPPMPGWFAVAHLDNAARPAKAIMAVPPAVLPTPIVQVEEHAAKVVPAPDVAPPALPAEPERPPALAPLWDRVDAVLAAAPCCVGGPMRAAWRSAASRAAMTTRAGCAARSPGWRPAPR